MDNKEHSAMKTTRKYLGRFSFAIFVLVNIKTDVKRNGNGEVIDTTNRKEVNYMNDDLTNMSVEEFCEAIGITRKWFDKKLKKAKKFLGCQPEHICIKFTKLSFCPYGVCPYCGEYLSKMFDKIDEDMQKKIKRIGRQRT